MDVVGPICESSDILGRDRVLLPRAGDLVAITGAGAYGAVMASGYNSRPSAAEVMVEGERVAIMRPSLGIERQIADERIPDWLGASELTGGDRHEQARSAADKRVPPAGLGRARVVTLERWWPAVWPSWR